MLLPSTAGIEHRYGRFIWWGINRKTCRRRSRPASAPKVLVRTGKPVTEQGEKLADWVLNSLADLPAAIKKRV